MSKLNITVNVETKGVSEEIAIIESVQALVKNLSLDNLKLLAKKSAKPGVNKKIQSYKHFM